MIRAYLLVNAASGTVEDVVEQVRAVDCVTEAHVVAGDTDLVVEVEDEDLAALRRAVTGEIRALDGVVLTRTYVVLG